MDDMLVFSPNKKRGIIFHLLGLAFFLTLGVLGMLEATHSPAGLAVMLYLVLALLAVIFFLVWLYRFYALWTATYSLERDGIRLRWGFRSEDIPIDKVLWVRSEKDIPVHLPLPFLRWPGAVAGLRHWPGFDGSGSVLEFMAERSNLLIGIATAEKVYAISPADEVHFLESFQYFREMGSLTPLQAKTVQPGFLFPEVWEDIKARVLIITAIILVIGLLAWVGIIIPNHQQISLRVSPTDLANEYVPAVQLMLLPVLNILFFVVNFSLGLFFYQRIEIRPLAYLLWSSSVVVSILFIGAVFFIVRAA
jgi:hypothetical protein